MTYRPTPADTSSVILSDEVLQLAEILARNTHENWSARRISEGWVYGPKRDDALKHHPCLVPYEELPESEKEIDRTTAMEAIKVMLASGFRITRKKDGE